MPPPRRRGRPARCRRPAALAPRRPCRRAGARRPRPVASSTTRWSGFTVPETTASPSPGLASSTARCRRPLTGSAVNSTPATLRVDHPLDDDGQPHAGVVDAGLARGRPTARSVHSDAQQRRTASSTRVGADDVEVGVLLAGEARGRQVLGGGRRADGDGHVRRRAPRYAAVTAAATSSGTGAARSRSRAARRVARSVDARLRPGRRRRW